jgi:hypothetical protein
MAEKYLDDDALAREVDKLLRKLPGADPYLKGDPEPAGARVHAPALWTVTGSRPAVGLSGLRPATRVQRISVWVRVFVALMPAVLITQWPYASGCGFGLWVYLFALWAVVIAAGWSAAWAWRYRMAAAHGASLLVIAWGAGLVADPVLQRVGYAAVQATWSCAAVR